MREEDLLLLTIYIIVVAYVFYRMIKSVDVQIKVSLDQEAINQQLREQDIQDIVGVTFILKKRYEINDPKSLTIKVDNKSQNHTIYVDWDSSTLNGYDGRARRIIWLTPNPIRDLAAPQVYNVVPPTKALIESISTEDIMELDLEKRAFDLKAPIINITKLASGKKADKALYNGFMDQGLEFKYSVYLALRIFEIAVAVSDARLYVVNCPFTVKKLHWSYALPWNQEKKKG